MLYMCVLTCIQTVYVVGCVAGGRGFDCGVCVCAHLVALVCKGECNVVRQSGASLSPWVHSTHSADASANASLSSPESM